MQGLPGADTMWPSAANPSAIHPLQPASRAAVGAVAGVQRSKASPAAGPGLAAAAAAGASAAAARAHTFLWTVLELLGAMYLSMRYFTGPTCWTLFFWMLWREPVLRLPLLLYHLYIITPPGRRAVATCRWPRLMHHFPLYWGQARYFAGSRLVRTAPLDPSRRYVFAAHPHGLLGNAFFLAFCTDLLGFSQLFPGIRLSLGGWLGRWLGRWVI